MGNDKIPQYMGSDFSIDRIDMKMYIFANKSTTTFLIFLRFCLQSEHHGRGEAIMPRGNQTSNSSTF